ncbi:MAG TPA: hypothetical protein VFT59_03125, partial [Candidatus Saccharimonadales bacterium]|nr:hypothetical protein [Candidatus Saccharimonadales bacterium]
MIGQTTIMTAEIAEVSELLEGLEKFGDFYLMVKPAELQLESDQILVRNATGQEAAIKLTPAVFAGSEEARRALRAYADAELCLVQGPCLVAPEGYEWVQHTMSEGVELRLVGTKEVPPGADLHRTQTFTKRSAQLLGTAPPPHTSWSGAV